jgi:hypothetical protein
MPICRKGRLGGAKSISTLSVGPVRIAQVQLVRPKAKYPNHATIIDHNFSKEQLGLIYRLLDLLEEAIPWEGARRNRAINTLKAWDLIYKHRERRDRPADHDEPRHQRRVQEPDAKKLRFIKIVAGTPKAFSRCSRMTASLSLRLGSGEFPETRI